MIDRILQNFNPNNPKGTPLEKAVGWIKNHRIPNSGIVVHHKTKTTTPEVTGYIIESLYWAGEKELAKELALWEASVQRADGAVAAPGVEIAYTFDTAQVIRGYLAVVDDLPQIDKNLRSACDYVEQHIDKNGVVLTDSYDMWKLPDGSMLHEYGNLYVLPALLQAGKKLNVARYTDAAKRGMDNYRKKSDLVEFKPFLGMLSHYFGYMMEALADMGEFELAKKGLANAAAIQRPDGSIPAYPGVNWICPTGIAQLSLAWYKVGVNEPADKAMAYLDRIQNPSGGFYGGFGPGALYFPGQEISWAAKFFIDACLLREKVHAKKN